MTATKVEDFQEQFLKEVKNTLSHILVGLGFLFPESEREAALVVIFTELKKEVLQHWQGSSIEKIPGVERKEVSSMGSQSGHSIPLEDLKKTFEYSKFLAEQLIFEEFLNNQHKNKQNFIQKLKQEERQHLIEAEIAREAEMKRLYWLEFAPDQILTIEKIVRSCYSNHERKKFAENSHGEKLEQHFSTPEMVLSQIDFKLSQLKEQFDNSLIRLNDTSRLYPQIDKKIFLKNLEKIRWAGPFGSDERLYFNSVNSKGEMKGLCLDISFMKYKTYIHLDYIQQNDQICGEGYYFLDDENKVWSQFDLGEFLNVEKIIRACFWNPNRKKYPIYSTFKNTTLFTQSEDPEYILKKIEEECPKSREKFDEAKILLGDTARLKSDVEKEKFIEDLKKLTWCGPFVYGGNHLYFNSVTATGEMKGLCLQVHFNKQNSFIGLFYFKADGTKCGNSHYFSNS